MHSRWRWASFLSASAITLGCLKPPGVAGTTDAEWVELQSEHFRLVSDLDEPEAARVLAGFEEIYGVLGSVVFRGGAVPAYTTQAIIFESTRDMQEFAGAGFGGIYMSWLPNDLEPAPTMIANGTLSPFARMAFAHELAHRFNHVGLGPTPIWLNEGLADYYSTVRAEQGKPVLGEIDPRYQCTPNGLGDLQCWEYERVRAAELPSAGELLAMDRDTFYGTEATESGLPTWEQKRRRSKNYGMAWLLVHMLMHGEQPYAQRFREVLKAPASAKKGAALAEVVQLTPNQQLDRDLRQYLQKRLPWRQHHASLPPAPPEVSRRGLSRSEALVLLARLDAFKGDKARRAEDRLNLARNTPGGEAGVGAPAFWLGRYNQLQGDFVKAEELYLEATRIDPDNPDYLFGLVDLYWTDERTTWMEAAKSDRMNKTMAALVRIARSPYQLNAVAVHQMLAGDVPAALATTERACAVGSDCWICFHNRAAALFASGQVAQALQSERDAQLRQSESAAPRLVAMVRGALAFYSQAATDRESVQDQPTPGLIAP